MEDGAWRTLVEIADGVRARTGVEDPAQSISARIRDLRKEKFGGYVIGEQRRGEPSEGIHEYRIEGQATGEAQTGKPTVLARVRQELTEANRKAKAYKALCERAATHLDKINCPKAAEELRKLMKEIEGL